MFHLMRLLQENLRHLQEMGMSLHNNGVETLSGKSPVNKSPGNPSHPPDPLLLGPFVSWVHAKIWLPSTPEKLTWT